MVATHGDPGTGDAEADRPFVVVGAGQAGLATGYHLSARGLDFTILAADERVGDTWRNRWDSLELFTPAFFNGLPGMDFPADDPEHLPHKDEVADYLEAYAAEFDLPIKLSTRVTELVREEGVFRLETSDGPTTAEAVVVATGAHSNPHLPRFADELDDEVYACHSSEYRNPEQLQPGDVLVVGAGNSGTQIAAEVGADDPDRRVWLAGRDTGRLPRTLLGRDVYRFLVPTLYRPSRGSFLGRRLHRMTRDQGDPVFKPQYEAMEAAGVERVSRIDGIEDGRPISAEGEAFDAANVVWATGFRPHYPWIDLDVFDENGEPRHTRGVVEEAPGLYFVGLPWLHRLDSSLMGGVGKDAEYVAEHLRERVS